MSIAELEAVTAILASNRLAKRQPLWVIRDFFEQIAFDLGMPEEPLVILRVTANGVSGIRITPPNVLDGKILLYFHGGGFVTGSAFSHRHLAAKLAIETHLETYVVDYRLAPEEPFPAAVDDAYAAFHYLIDRGIKPENIVLAGDSAGGGLCLLLMLRLKNDGLSLPAAAALVSPWVDLSCSGDTYRTKAKIDPLITREGMQLAATSFLAGKIDERSPLVSPLFADLSGLPPLFIQVGGAETLLDDSVSLAERATLAGVDVRIEITERMVHVWHLFWPMLSEARDAIAEAAKFLVNGLEQRENQNVTGP